MPWFPGDEKSFEKQKQKAHSQNKKRKTRFIITADTAHFFFENKTSVLCMHGTACKCVCVCVLTQKCVRVPHLILAHFSSNQLTCFNAFE